MAPLTAALADWSASDVRAFIDQGVEEGQRLEYKRELDLDGHRQRREAAKDVSGMANAQGGLILYGVDEKQSTDGRRVPHAATPLTDGGVQARLEDVLYSAVLPRLNLESRLLPTDGGYFLVVRVFQRAGAPHMVAAYDEKRCYVRTGLSTRPMEQHELEAAYQGVAESRTGIERRLRHLPLVPRLQGIELAPVPTRMAGPWASVVTLALDAADPLFELRPADHLAFPDDGDYERWGREGILWGGLNWDAHGYVHEHRGHAQMTDRVRLYRNGVFEWGRAYRADGETVPSVALAAKVHDAIGYFATCYQRAGYFGRVRLWAALDDAEGTELALNRSLLDRGAPLGAAHVEWTADENVERLAHDLDSVAHAAMDHIWVAYGFSRCHLFDEHGTYRP